MIYIMFNDFFGEIVRDYYDLNHKLIVFVADIYAKRDH